MIQSMNPAILIGSVLVIAAVFTSLISFRFGAPLLLVFLIVGLLAGEDGLGLKFDNAAAAYYVGSIALAIILFDAGFETRFATLRIAAAPAVVLATLGVVLTAVLVASVAHFLLRLTFLEGLLLGAIVAPTDAAAVFFLLRVGGITLRDRVRSTLEIESGTNDPIAIFLTLAMVGLVVGPASVGDLTTGLLLHLLLEIGIGAVAGIVAGYLIVQIVNRTDFEAALYPIVVLALALAAFALTAMIGGSGFLAVYVAGLVSGNARMRHAVPLRRFQSGTTWLAQIAMFLTLGLLATPSQFSTVLGGAIGLAVFLIVVARPVAVWLCLLPFGFTRHEMAFVSWVGLRGAVSILLAILPIIAGLASAPTIFNTAFIVVIASLLVQGWTIRPVARFLGLIVPARHGPVDRIELELPGGRGEHELVAYHVHPDSAVARGERIPRWARPSLTIRDGRSLRPHRAGRPQAGDQVYVITTPEYVGLLDRLFAGSAPRTDDPRLYGEFILEPGTRLAELEKAYDVPVAAADRDLTLAALLRRELAGDIEQGDRIPLGPVDVIVRGVDDAHRITEVGLALEHGRQARPRIPLFQSPREIRALLRSWRRPRTIEKAQGDGPRSSETHSSASAATPPSANGALVATPESPVALDDKDGKGPG